MYSRMEKYHGRRAQRFSIRKYSFGAASVLLGTALLLGANAVKADETSTASTKTSEVTNSDKQKPDSAITTPVVEELPELKIDAVKADEKPEVKEEAKPVAEKEVTDKAATEKSDKEQADKKEVAKEKTDKESPKKAATEKAQDEVKTVLTQLTSEAEVMASVASNFSDKEVKDEAAKKELAVTIEAVKLEAAKSNDLLSSDASKDQMVAQVNRLSAAIEAVYTEMKRAGHAGKVESVLAATASKITGKDVLKDGETVNAVTNAYVDMNADNTKPVGWGFDTTISTSTLKAGSITKIELTNLAELGGGLAVNTEIRETDGTVVGKVKSIDYKTTTGNNNNKSTPYWGQRTQRGMTYDQRVAEQPAVANETGTYTYNIEWNDKVKDYPNVSFGASNLSGSGYYAPEISKDTPYTATIKIDGRTVLEHTYTRKGQQPNYQKQGTSASLSENNGLTYLNNEQTGRSDSIVLKTDSDVRYGVGSKFTIKLPNADFTEFKELEGSSNFVNGLNTASTINPNKGDSITYRPASRWANVKANENNVWILNDGRDSGFTLTPRLISPTELELTVTEGAIQEGSVVSMPLQSLGIEKVIKDKTLTSEYSKITYENGLIKEGYVGNDKTAATLTVSGGESVNGEKEDVATTVPNGWSVKGDGKVQGEPPTGAVVRTFKDLVTGEVIGFEPTRYTGNIPLSEDGSKDYTNVLGNKYDVSNDPVDLVKEVNGEEYILADIPAENTKGTLSVTKTRARDLYSEEELKAKGINGSAFVTPAEYDYVKKTKVEEVNRTIKFVYADNVAGLAGTEVFPSQKQTVSYTGSIKLTAEGKAVINSNDRPVYINWKGTDGQSTDLPELAVPQKEGYIASVEKVPVQATTATDEDYEYVVKYTAIQKAKTIFVDEKGNAIPGVAEITEQGGSETPLTKEADVKAKIKELENKGYELVSNTYPEGGKFDTDKDTDQEFKVILKQKEVTVTPDQPKTPGTPVDLNNPDGPKYPAGLEEKDLNKTVTRTITYVYEDGTPVLNEDGTPKTVTQEAKFTREAKVNLVTGEVTYGDWSEAKDLAEVKSPVVTGFLADKASVPVVNVTGDSKDITEVVTYKPIGSWIPNIPGQPTNPIKYPNNPDDPTQPGKPTEVLPYVPGFTPKDKDGNPLKPVDPADPTKGYIVPDLPTDPSQDTPINYVKDTQKAKTTFVDEKGNPIPGVDAITEEGDSDTPLTKEADVKAKIKELENKGYELVSNTYPEGGKFDKDKDTDQEFKVTLKAKEVTVTPDQPKTPGTPVDPNNPDGPKYPAGLEEKDLNKTVTRTITYVYADGTPVLNEDGTPKTVTQEAKFTREAKVNLVTGEVTYGDWSEAKDLPEVKSPVVKGYLADKATVPATKVTADSENTKEVVTYKPIGSWIPNIPGQPTNPIKYPNDPTDPTKPGQPTETLPYVPGFTPEDKDGNPLKPVDPNDPTKGYEVPSIPTNPGEDTLINYVANKANLVVKYVDENGKELLPTETKEGKVGDDYSTSGKVITGYVLDRVEGEAKGKIGTDGTTVTYVYKPLGSWIPNIPGQPTNPIKYPNDPTDPTKPGQPTETLPYVPGFTPEDKDGNPLKPVDPNDPTKGYEVPSIPTNPGEDTPINYVANKANLVVKYVDENGKELLPTETKEGKVGDDYSTSGKVITGYVLDRVEGEAKGKIGTDGTTVTYVYKPLGSWIPNIPGQPTTPIKYPNDPQDPTKPGQPTEVLPYVPGFTPEDKDGNPLKPVDPKDPSKGYVVPNIPTNPGEDTPINYIPNVTPNGDQDGYTPQPKPQPEQVVTYYVDENGKDIAPSEKGAQAPKGISGYEYVTTTKDPNGNLVHHYKKVATPQPVPTTPETPEQPVAPVQPEQPTTPTQPAVPTPAETSVPTDSATKPATPKYVDGQKELPNTGTEANASLAAFGLLGALGGFGLLARKKKED
ncbi:mucin-binding protein [Streptococcus mitis]|uniref:Cell surface protein n=1 Tax=Streptococcus mitis TaxID=28037 RepID=A0AAX2L4F8_STRMT|nr:MucBP domain-containing protein [Streptococcus mitis]MBZ2104405.1 MucBP domain-containing protein [Streptococcus mitis]QGS42642.1 YSIRK-type signal peptide-containing protein [Streptococcus mitis]QXA55290.1 MucBP domain-containing protein [Streptococcus mitis]WMS24829.1 MucBP domain-containing protein [Streptococcus mitis]SUN74739.1 cell surface protein precursor [Streptococcus mitis]